MVKAIIFDCFGVLATEAWLPFKAKYFPEAATHEQAGYLVKQANSGLISYQDFIERIAELAKITPDKVSHAIRQNVPNEPLFDYIKRDLKPKYKLGFLSNVADDYMHRLFTPEQRGLFDAITLSYKTGYIKPDPQAYTVAADNLKLDPQDCVLVDDSESNVAGARQAGMRAILYQDFDQFKADLAKILADSKS